MSDDNEKFLGTGAVLHEVEDTMAAFSEDIAAAHAAQAAAPAVQGVEEVAVEDAPEPAPVPDAEAADAEAQVSS